MCGRGRLFPIMRSCPHIVKGENPLSPRKSLPPEMRVGYDPNKVSTFCLRIRERREAIGMTQAELGEILNMRATEVSAMEGGKFPRQEWRFTALAKAMGVSLDWLFGLTDE